MKPVCFLKIPAAIVLSLAMALFLSGCFGSGDGQTPAEPQITEGEPELKTEIQAPEEPSDERIVVFSAAGVTVRAETPEQNSGSPALTLYFDNTTGEEALWTIESLTLDGFEIPLGSECRIPAGEQSRYSFPLDDPMVSVFLGKGEHRISVSSTLTDADGNVLARADSDTVTVRFG